MTELESLTNEELRALETLTQSPGWVVFQNVLKRRVENLGALALGRAPAGDGKFEYDMGFYAGQNVLVKQGLLQLKNAIPSIMKAKDAIARRTPV